MTKSKRKPKTPIEERIFTAARELFLRHGFEGVSVRKIAQRAGCSAGMLYHCFSNKELLLARVVADTLRRLDATLAREAARPGSPWERLGSVLRAYIEFGLEHPHEYAFLFAHPAPQMGRDVASVFETHGLSCFRRIRDLCQECLRLQQPGGDPGAPDELAQAVWASVHGLVHLLESAKGFPFVDRGRLIRRQVDLLLRGAGSGSEWRGGEK